MERSPHSPKLFNSAVERSLARTRSHKEWASEKLHELHQPATLQRFSRSETKVTAPTEPRIKLTTDPSYTSHSQHPTTKLTQDTSTHYGNVPTQYEPVNTQDPELWNRNEDQATPSRIPTSSNNGIPHTESTDSNMKAQWLPPAVQWKDTNKPPLQEPNPDTQRKAPNHIQTNGLVGCPLLADECNPPRPQACNPCIAPGTWWSKTRSNFVEKRPSVRNEVAMDTEESHSKADVTPTTIPPLYTEPNSAICNGAPTMELDDSVIGASTLESIPNSHSHKLDMRVETWMSTPKPSIRPKLRVLDPSGHTDEAKQGNTVSNQRVSPRKHLTQTHKKHNPLGAPTNRRGPKLMIDAPNLQFREVLMKAPNNKHTYGLPQHLALKKPKCNYHPDRNEHTMDIDDPTSPTQVCKRELNKWNNLPDRNKHTMDIDDLIPPTQALNRELNPLTPDLVVVEAAFLRSTLSDESKDVDSVLHGSDVNEPERL